MSLPRSHRRTHFVASDWSTQRPSGLTAEPRDVPESGSHVNPRNRGDRAPGPRGHSAVVDRLGRTTVMDAGAFDEIPGDRGRSCQHDIVDLERERAVRAGLFEHLDALTHQAGSSELNWEVTGSFEFGDERFTIRQTRGRGIGKPRNLDAALSVTTAYTPIGHRAPYLDTIGPDGFQRYHYEGSDPNLPTNRALRACMEYGLGLVYFIGVSPGVYAAIYPVYVIGDDANRCEVTLGFDTSRSTDQTGNSDSVRRYALTTTRRRIHQPLFRADVLRAYETRCAVCRVRHRELLDAAHIVPDSQPRGDPIVPNGIALCKIHHAAFDTNLMGIRADGKVRVNRELLSETDGPMLRHGFQELHDVQIATPRRAQLRPDPERLQERFDTFLATG